MKCYGIDLRITDNFQMIMTNTFAELLKSLKGLLGVCPYANGQTQAALFDTPEHRDEAFKEISKLIKCTSIPEPGYIP